MTSPTPPVTIALRIPGTWSGPQELIERLPAGFHLSAESLIMPDGTEIEFGAMEADDQFAGIFRSSCREPPTEEEQATVDAYTVNVFLKGPGGSMESARTMMEAAAAIIQAGGAGVFIDNSAVAHGGQQWRDMTQDGSPDALSFAFVAIVGGKTEVWTMGMHALGLRDIVMKRTDADKFDIIDMIRYVCQCEKPMEDGHLIADLGGPRFKVLTEAGDKKLAGTPLGNPYGRLRLVSLGNVAERN